MPEVIPLSERDRSWIEQAVSALKADLSRIDPAPPGRELQTLDHLKSLRWTQYEGIDLETKTVLRGLLLIAQHLIEQHGFELMKSNDLLVLVHPQLIGYAPLDMLAYRPLQPADGNWLDEDDPIDRALNAVEKIEAAIGPGPRKSSDWMEILLGTNWLWAMQHSLRTKT